MMMCEDLRIKNVGADRVEEGDGEGEGDSEGEDEGEGEGE